ncbi:MAG: hypothetical protein K0Q94_3152 [Paenibacillus sp.]|uniref:SMI1/KNR4 family protein n=1 Tax=Paenibacillus sp. GCM10012303 TaxID=3317340 RepID=UPI0029ED24CF|nr:hypothetical protein [Paenibacillus sp.]
MNNKIDEFMIWADEKGWDLTRKSNFRLNLDGSVTARYKEIPNEYLDFLSAIQQCVSPNEQTWFICEDEFNSSSDAAFQWNECEMLSLEAAMDDEIWKSEITAWWDRYLPIVMSVEDGYSFYAIDVTEDQGAVVRGSEPEFEEVDKVANSFEQFLEFIMSNAIKFQ